MNYNLSYDVVFIHPPAIYDFREKSIFPGSLSTVERIQFIKVSIGILSIADYLDRHGYKVIVDNLADRMVHNKDYDITEHLRKVSSKIFAIGLHWQQHSQGAIEIAKLCKKLHPKSLVIMGGLTATYFHEEIIRKYNFVDAVIRGEAERPFLGFLEAFNKYGEITSTPNLTYRKDNGEVCVTPLAQPVDNLDEFEFTRLDLLDPLTSVYNPNTDPRWSLTVCRGCSYNCVQCGGSAYTYKTYLGRGKPAFRSPNKIISDIKKLNEQGINQIGLYQDPRMGGREYWKELVRSFRSEKLDILRLTIDIFAPIDEEFIKDIESIGKEVILYICPDTGSDKVRRFHGRNYSNKDLMETVNISLRHHIPITAFFSVGLAGENNEVIEETWNIWKQLCLLNQDALNKGDFGDIQQGILIQGPIIGTVLIDPGSLAFNSPEKYGYKLSFNTLEGYIDALSLPSWHQWINYETDILNKDKLIDLILDVNENFILQMEKNKVLSSSKANIAYIKAKADRIVVSEINNIMKVYDREERELKLKVLNKVLRSFLSLPPSKNDPYNYQKKLAKSIISANQNYEQ